MKVNLPSVCLHKKPVKIFIILLLVLLFFTIMPFLGLLRAHIVKWLIDSGRIDLACSLDPLYTRMRARSVLNYWACKVLRGTGCGDPQNVNVNFGRCFNEFRTVYDVCKKFTGGTIIINNVTYDISTTMGCRAFCGCLQPKVAR
jgi:hypothetical protein